MGLDHNFIYFASDKYYDEIWRNIHFHPLRIEDDIIPKSEYVSIHDDILRYYHDYLVWTKLYNPCKKEYVNGLCYYGITTIYGDALFQFKSIIDGLLKIFSNAPIMVKLKGNYIIGEDCYDKIFIEKVKIIDIFDRLNKLIERAIERKDYIIHCGI